jgi:hypothetical protein
MSDDCVMGTRNEGRITSLENQVKKDELDNDKKFTEIFSILKEIRNHFSSRPSWAVTVVLTLLSSVCVGLIVRLASL